MPFSGINRKRLTDTFVELLMIDSPSFKEEEIGKILSARLTEAGCRVETQRYGESFNIVARKKGSSGALPLLLSGHMDTIESTAAIEFSVDDVRIKSTGRTVLGADDKSALAQIIEVLMVLHEQRLPHGDLEIVFTSAEETGLVGARNLDFRSIGSRHALVLDSSGDVGRLVVSAPTQITYEMRVIGRPAHAGIEPEKGINAIRIASAIIAGVPDGRIDGETTANIGVIRGGTATNVVPKETVIRGELRSRRKEVLEKNKKLIFETAGAVAKEYGAEVFISEKEEYRSFTIDQGDAFLGYLRGAVDRCGIQPVLVETGGGSDANVFNEAGIRAINMANGMKLVHSSDEYIDLSDLYDGCRVVLQAIADFREFNP